MMVDVCGWFFWTRVQFPASPPRFLFGNYDYQFFCGVDFFGFLVPVGGEVVDFFESVGVVFAFAGAWVVDVEGVVFVAANYDHVVGGVEVWIVRWV